MLKSWKDVNRRHGSTGCNANERACISCRTWNHPSKVTCVVQWGGHTAMAAQDVRLFKHWYVYPKFVYHNVT